MSGSVGPRKRENPETELHQVPGTTPRGGWTVLGTSLPPLLGWRERQVGTRLSELLSGTTGLAFGHPKRPRPGSLALCPVSPLLRDPQPPVPSHLTWPRHPAHPRHSLTNWGAGAPPPPRPLARLLWSACPIGRHSLPLRAESSASEPLQATLRRHINKSREGGPSCLSLGRGRERGAATPETPLPGPPNPQRAPPRLLPAGF